MTAEDLRVARQDSANVAYQTFIQHVSQDKNGFFCFFEGKDAPYYNLRIKKYVLQKESFPIICKGKSMVLKTYGLINNHREYDKYSKGFFIDKDFDVSVTPQYGDSIYETPTYSIENFYIKIDTVKDILKNELGLTEVEVSFGNAIDLYKTLLTNTLECQSLFNAWYYCLKAKREKDALNTTGVSLEDKFPKDYWSLSIKEVTVKYDINRIKLQYKDAIAINDEDIYAKHEELKNADMESVFRGKYLLEFLFKYINLIVTDSNTEKIVIKHAIKYQIALNQVVSMYSQYAHTPDSLNKYLQQFA